MKDLRGELDVFGVLTCMVNPRRLPSDYIHLRTVPVDRYRAREVQTVCLDFCRRIRYRVRDVSPDWTVVSPLVRSTDSVLVKELKIVNVYL